MTAQNKIPEIRIVMQTPQLVTCIKPVGIDSENQMPSLLEAQCGCEPFCVHRLDRTVSGIMVYALSSRAAAALSSEIQQGNVTKEYYAAVSGCPDAPEGKYDDLLWKDSAKQKAFVVKRERKGVKKAALQYSVIETTEHQGEPVSLVRVKLLTGRFHQIRVQFASRNMPLMGDRKYGSRIDGCTPALFSTCIRFPDPKTGNEITAEANPPAEFPWNLFSAFTADLR